MSWDRVIQDSDEEEPLIEDDFPVSPDPLQPTQSPKVQHHDNPAEADTHYPIERTTNEGFPEPQLNVNFDQFLQSQGTHAASTSSQQQREERWIPSTTESGGGSIGAMITEIGLAQNRLFDESSSADQRISTTTYYPSEISQPGSFPTMQSYQYQQHAPIAHGNVQYTNIPREQPYEATQLLTPGAAVPVSDYSLPTASSHVDSPSDVTTAPTSAPYLGEGSENLSKNFPQQLHPVPAMAYSPHDTEPFSSVTSPHVNMSKNENPMPGLMSPHHPPGDANDELAFPGVTVEVPSATKKRRSRPKKASLPEDDDDDELAIETGTEPSPTKPMEESVGNADVPKPTEEAIETGDDAASIQNTTDVISAPEENTVPEAGSTAIEQPQKSHADDDVIWVDSRPLQTNGAQEESGMTAEAKQPEVNGVQDAQPAPKKRGRKRKQATERIADDLDSVSNTDSTNATDEKPAPKKRGRKRKQPVELVEPAEVQDPVSKNDVAVNDTEKIEEPKDETNPEAEAVQQPEPEPQANTATEEMKEQVKVPPQTPQKPEQNPSTPVAGNSTNGRKGLSKHSPISSTSKVPYRVGLSKRARIAPLLKIVRK
ncbi:uncharacterized protein N7483_011917 [Penicillium malachiteum]|uniref:uncharacterized protein n=1 Tax=Penicillium malachiteum TaxID=1324776 RepID=UPI0025497C7F|nr:uncharacterized protein N7483_011917 [Penicillium malachiteum]KAJ5714736.1 hypothetical protein N7483_011917 [Penicillium malachiteum]